MSIGSRIRERRVYLSLTQEDLALLVGVTKGAIANYENGVSTPKIDVMYKLFDALHCDANYLHQDDMHHFFSHNATPEEFERIILKYRALDESGKKMVDTILDQNYERCHPERNKKDITA